MFLLFSLTADLMRMALMETLKKVVLFFGTFLFVGLCFTHNIAQQYFSCKFDLWHSDLDVFISTEGFHETIIFYIREKGRMLHVFLICRDGSSSSDAGTLRLPDK